MHSHEEYNKPIQELMSLLKDDYPNDFELKINSYSAELIYNASIRTFISEEEMKAMKVRINNLFKTN